jgi:uroporphyrinogen-III synthase
VTHPLAGKRVVSTRPEAQAQEFVAMLREAGAIPVIFPTIQIAPLEDTSELDSALRRLSDYEWVVFTSVNGVNQSLERMQTLAIPLETIQSRQIAVIGPATRAALNRFGIEAALQPDEYIAEAIVESLKAYGPIAGKRFLLLRADIARAALREQLVEVGANVDEVSVYRTVRGEPAPEAYSALRAGVDVITFTSSSTVRYFFDLLGDEVPAVTRGAKIICIGPITAKTARDLGLNVDGVAEEYTVPGLVSALTEIMERS